MKHTPKNIPSPYKFAGTKIFRDTTALPFADGGPLHDRNINGKLLNSTYASALNSMFREGGPFGENKGTFDYATSIYASQPGNYYANGGYTVRRSNDRKGKTHVVTGPDGTKKYFGDPKMGERSKSKNGKEAFYARHKHNLAGNPYFRAYARATWELGGQMNSYANGGQFLTAGGEYHKIYKNADGDIIVNHPKEDKGKWDTINLTNKANAKTVAEGIAATKKWHAENPNVYKNGGLIKRADGSYSPRGLWDNIRANKGSGKKPTKEMLEQEKKITNSYAEGGQLENKCGPGYYWNGKECVKSFIPTAKTKTETVTKNKKEQELIDYGKKTLPNKKVTNNPVQNIPFYGDISNAAQPDNLIENITEFADQTGYFSWDDAYRAKAAWDKSNSKYPTANQTLDMFGAVPALGKLGKLKYLKNADAIKNSMKYVAPAFGIIPWQSILNKVDTGQDINQDNISYRKGGQFPRPYSLPEDSFKQGGTNLHNSIYASSLAQYPAVYAEGGELESGCPPGFYYNGKNCVKLPKSAFVTSDPNEYKQRIQAYRDSSITHQNVNKYNKALQNVIKKALATGSSNVYDPYYVTGLTSNYGFSSQDAAKKHARKTEAQANKLETRLFENIIGDSDQYAPEAGREIGLFDHHFPVKNKRGFVNSLDNYYQYYKFPAPKQPVVFAKEYSKEEPIKSKLKAKPITKKEEPITKKEELIKQDVIIDKLPIRQAFINQPEETIITQLRTTPKKTVKEIDVEYSPEYIEEGSPDTEVGMELVNKPERYIDWQGTSIGYRLPRFRKPGHGGDLIKKGKQRYIHLPTIETRNTAELVPDNSEYKNGGMMSRFYASNVPDNNISNKDLTYPENSYVYAVGGNLNNSIMNKYPNVTNILRSGIHINPANKGKFTASANAAGMGVQEFASHVLANKDDYSSTQVKRANFARNAAGWKHEMGGNLNTASPLTNMMGIPAKSMAMTFKYGGFNNPGFNALPKEVQAKIKARTFENGGTMPQLTEFNEGGRHEENPLGGIPQGVAGDGRLNLVEEGETKLNAANYIFSDTLKLDKGIAEAFNLPKGDVGKTFSDISKKLNRPNSRRDNDTIEQNAIQRDLENLMQAQEAFKEVDLQKDLEMMKTKHPELMEAMDMAMQQQSAQQQEPSPEEMQQGAPQPGSPEEQAMMEQQMMAQQEGMAPEEMAQIPMSYGGAMFMRGGKMCYADGGRMYPAGGAMQNAYTVSGNMPAYDNRQFMSPVGMQNEPMFGSQEEAAAYMQNPTNEVAIAQWNNPETGMGGQVQSNFYLNPNQPGTLTYPGAGSNKQMTRDLSAANTPQFSFMPNNNMALGYKTGGHMYGKGGQVLRSIGAGAYGVGEGLLDTLTFGLTDDLTDKGYNALANIGGRNEKDLERDAMIRGFGNTAGAIGGAVVSGGAATGSAISEGSEGLGQGLSNIHGTNAEFDKTVNSLAKMGSMAGGLVGGGNPAGALGGATGAAGIAEGATQVPQFAQTMMKAGQNPFLQQATGMAGSMIQRNGGSMYPSMYKYGGSFEMPRQQMYMPLDNVERMGGHMYVEGGIMDSDPPKININGKLYTKDEALQAANFGEIILEPEEINTYFSEFPSSNENYNLEYEGSLEDTDTDETNIQIQDEEDLANITYPGASNPNIITGGKGDYSEEILAAQNMLKNAKNPKDKADAEAYLSSLKRMQTDLENRNVDLKMKQTPMQALGLALPAAYNIGMGLFSKPMKFKEEEFVNKARITPYKVNIDPQLNEARLAYNAAEQSVKNNAPSAGAYLSNRANLASLRAKSFKDVLAGKENADAQLQMQADLQNAQLGSQNLQNKLAIQQLNAQAEAAKQKMLQTGIGQVGQIAQNAQAMDAQEKYMRLISPQYGKTFEYQTIFDQVKDYYKNKKSSKETKE